MKSSSNEKEDNTQRENEILIRVRRELGLTKIEVADKINIRERDISAYELLSKNPWGARGLKPKAKKLLKFYGLPSREAFPFDLYQTSKEKQKLEEFFPTEDLRVKTQVSEELRKKEMFPSPEDSAIDKQIEEKIRKALSQLSTVQHQVLRLYYFEDCILKEIAKLLNVSNSRVDHIKREALKKLSRSGLPGNRVNINL